MRKVVKFLETNDDGTQSVAGTVMFDGGEVTFQDISPPNIRYFERTGILIGSKTIYPKDGLKYLENLKFAFSDSRFRATDVEGVER